MSGDGLPRWTEPGPPLINADVVLWYTFGHTHLPRPENYPVMPAAHLGFLLKPHGFFAEKPANDVLPSAKKAAAKGGLLPQLRDEVGRREAATCRGLVTASGLSAGPFACGSCPGGAPPSPWHRHASREPAGNSGCLPSFGRTV